MFNWFGHKQHQYLESTTYLADSSISVLARAKQFYPVNMFDAVPSSAVINVFLSDVIKALEQSSQQSGKESVK